MTIILFIFFTMKYYFSHEHKKESYRSFNSLSKNIDNYVLNLTLLKSDTDNIIDYVEFDNKDKKKRFHFWKLLSND